MDPRRSLSLLFAFLVPLALGCEATPTSEEAPLDPPPEETDLELAQPAQAWLDRTLDLKFYTDAQLDEIASCPLAIFQLRLILSEEGAPKIAALRQRNPDLVILGVFQVLSYVEHWNEESMRERFPLTARAYDLLEPHTALTNEGEVPLMWAEAPMVTPWADGGLDTALLDALTNIVVEEERRHPGLLDGVMHDYMSTHPWIYPSPTLAGIGDVDLDGDGVGAFDDPDDEEVWQAWQIGLLDRWQSAFGDDFIQIANGALPHRNPEAAQRMAGIIYEAFPTMVWHYTALEGLDLLMSHLEPGYLTPRRGRSWSILWDRAGSSSTLCRISSMLSDQLYALSDLEGYPGLDPERGEPSVAISAVQRRELEDGGVVFERLFEDGMATIELNASGYPTRVLYENW